MKGFKSFNINHTVFIKFTELGFNKLVEQNEEYRGQFPNWKEKNLDTLSQE